MDVEVVERVASWVLYPSVSHKGGKLNKVLSVSLQQSPELSPLQHHGPCCPQSFTATCVIRVLFFVDNPESKISYQHYQLTFLYTLLPTCTNHIARTPVTCILFITPKTAIGFVFAILAESVFCTGPILQAALSSRSNNEVRDSASGLII